MKIIPYDESVLLESGEGDIDKAFKRVEKLFPPFPRA